MSQDIGDAAKQRLDFNELLATFPSRQSGNNIVKEWIMRVFEFRGLDNSNNRNEWVNNVYWVGYELHDLPKKRLDEQSVSPYDPFQQRESARLVVESIVYFRDYKVMSGYVLLHTC